MNVEQINEVGHWYCKCVTPAHAVTPVHAVTIRHISRDCRPPLQEVVTWQRVSNTFILCRGDDFVGRHRSKISSKISGDSPRTGANAASNISISLLAWKSAFCSRSSSSINLRRWGTSARLARITFSLRAPSKSSFFFMSCSTRDSNSMLSWNLESTFQIGSNCNNYNSHRIRYGVRHMLSGTIWEV